MPDTAHFEIYCGPLSLDKQTRRKSAGFVNEDEFLIFNTLLKGLFPRFDWYDGTCLSVEECQVLVKTLQEREEAIGQANSLNSFEEICETSLLCLKDLPIANIKRSFLRLTREFKEFAQRAIEEKKPLSLLGL